MDSKTKQQLLCMVYENEHKIKFETTYDIRCNIKVESILEDKLVK
jgi:hypothetical protein